MGTQAQKPIFSHHCEVHKANLVLLALKVLLAHKANRAQPVLKVNLAQLVLKARKVL